MAGAIMWVLYGVLIGAAPVVAANCSCWQLPRGPRGGRELANIAYFHVTSIPKKWRNTSRLGRFFGFCCGLRM